MYYNPDRLVNNFCTTPREVIYLVDGSIGIRHPFLFDTENPSAGWLHILAIGFEGLRADRIGERIFITSQRDRSFVGGHA